MNMNIKPVEKLMRKIKSPGINSNSKAPNSPELAAWKLKLLMEFFDLLEELYEENMQEDAMPGEKGREEKDKNREA